MRTFKFLSIFVFLVVFINGKAYSFIHGFENKKDHSSKEIKVDQKLNSDNQDDPSTHKRKIKPRGIEVDVPQISDISFERRFIYKAFRPIWKDEIFSSFLYCVDLKRGPPLS